MQNKTNLILNTRFANINFKKIKNGVNMIRPSKLTKEIQQRIGDNIALGLNYSLAAEAAGITYKTFSLWMAKGEKFNFW